MRVTHKTNVHREWQSLPAAQLAGLYSYRVDWDAEDEIYVVTVADWPGLAGHGATQVAALKEGLRMVEGVVEVMREDKRPLPEPASLRQFNGKVLVRMGPDLHRALSLEASQKGKPLNQVIIEKLEAGA